MKKWESKEWWEKGQWAKEDIEEMAKEELEMLTRYPWFESGKPCKTDIFDERDWQEEFELIWGKWGHHGIGKLKKVALSRPHEYELNPVFEREPAYYRMYRNRVPDIEKWRKTIDEYAKVLKGEGVEIIWFDPPDTPKGPYGFLRAFCTPGLTCTKAGMILLRMGRAGCAGDIYSKRWFYECAKMGCPIYHTMLNVGEHTPIYLAEDSVVVAEGYPTPMAGVEEYKGLLETLGEEVWVAHNPGYLGIWGFPAGGTSHIDMVLATADLGLAIVYPSFLDNMTITYLKKKKIRLIEVPPEEFTEYGCNLLTIEPKKVLIPAAAKETIKALRKEGVECIDFDFSESAASGLGGPDCITGKLYRETGPSLNDL